MCRVLFTIPIPFVGREIAIFGFGVMLAAAMLLCTSLAARRYKSLGGVPEHIIDLSMWFLIGGVVGARIFFIVQYRDKFDHWSQFLRIWEGGMVFYGSAIGAIVGFLLFIGRTKLKPMVILDSIAPSIALGLALGRLGCFMNGCCYGDLTNVPWSVRYPFGADASNRLMSIGAQSMFGFFPSTEGIQARGMAIAWVEPGTGAKSAGLKPGDIVVGVQGNPCGSAGEVRQQLHQFVKDIDTKKGAPPLSLTVLDGDATRTLTVPMPRSLAVHPTQVYSSMGAFLLFLYLSAMFPFRTRDGQVFAALLLMYPVGRFMVEFLRFDEKPMWDGLTISQNISIPVFVVGVMAVLWLKNPARPTAPAAAG